MPDEISVTIRHESDSYRTAVTPGDAADRILLRSLDYFGIDPSEKADWRLRFEEQDRPDHGVYLDRSVNEQMSDGAVLVLEQRDAGKRSPATGSY